jgi:hypothetical protein
MNLVRRSEAMLFAIFAFAFLVRADDGILTVKTQPEGIEVWLDDKYVGDSPIMDKKLKPGRYALKLVDAVQHTSQVEDVFIQSGQTTLVEKNIVSKFGSLRISSEPQGAEVFLLTSLGETPVSNDFMNPGKYRLEIRHPQAKKAVEDIVIERGATVNLNKTLEPKSAFGKKDLARLVLGAGAIAGFVWAIVEQGQYKEYATHADPAFSSGQTRTDYQNKAKTANAWKWVGVGAGSLCVVGFEIIAFF